MADLSKCAAAYGCNVIAGGERVCVPVRAVCNIEPEGRWRNSSLIDLVRQPGLIEECLFKELLKPERALEPT